MGEEIGEIASRVALLRHITVEENQSSKRVSFLVLFLILVF